MRDIKFSDEQYAKLEESIKKHEKKLGSLMPILQDAQQIFGCISLAIQKY